MNNNNNNYSNMSKVGNFTKNAIENFEENIVNQTDYLEKIKNQSKKN
ncbi:hypothetical protein [Clostridium butyricum]|nr:hypothetical protein [Clostridium butyricum]